MLLMLASLQIASLCYVLKKKKFLVFQLCSAVKSHEITYRFQSIVWSSGISLFPHFFAWQDENAVATSWLCVRFSLYLPKLKQNQEAAPWEGDGAWTDIQRQCLHLQSNSLPHCFPHVSFSVDTWPSISVNSPPPEVSFHLVFTENEASLWLSSWCIIYTTYISTAHLCNWKCSVTW